MGDDKRRATNHSSRYNKKTKTAHSNKHNDRNFDAEHAKHIDTELSCNNLYIQWDMDDPNPSESFAACEERFYNDNFADGLEAKNQRYINQSHSERCQTMEDVLKGLKTCPEEEIMQLGDKKHSVDADTLVQVYNMFVEWHQEQYPNIIFLNAALHVDEPDAAPHIHTRKVWVGHDKDGNAIPNQARALEEMGIERPHPEEPKSRYNNPKMTYTKACRDKLLAICRELGIEIEEKPKEASKSGLELTELKLRETEMQLEEAKGQIEALEARALDAEKREKAAIEHCNAAETKAAAYEVQIATLSSEKQTLEAKVEVLSAQCDIEAQELEALLQDKIKAAEIKKPMFGANKDVTIYHAASLAQASDIAKSVDERSNAGRYERFRAEELKEEAAAIRNEYETKLADIEPLHQEAAALKQSYEQKLSKLDQTVEKRAQELADAQFNEFLHQTKDADKLEYAEKFMSQIDFADGSNALDVFNQQYEEILEEILEVGAHHGLHI